MIDLLKSIQIFDLILGMGTAYLVIRLVRAWIKAGKYAKQLKKERKELEDNKCKGAHNWIQMQIGLEKTHVCQDCCWSPKHESFIKKFYVNAEIESIKFEENLEKYKQKKIEELAAKYFMEADDLKIVAEEILKIKKDFTVEYLDKKIKELNGAD